MTAGATRQGHAARPGSRAGALEVSATVRVGELDLDVSFAVEPGQVVGLLGPNGAGKTTLLHAIAGLRRPSGGRIGLGDRTLDDPDAGLHRAPSERSVGVVFQDYLLFPHLSALENVAFGPRAGGADSASARERAERWLRRLHAADVADRRPDALSGGEAQRVALARALATGPDLLLLDEPLSALDAQARLDIRRELTAVLAGFRGPAVLVTHDPLEAAGLADRLLILEGGRITQEGTVDEVTRRPRSRWVARLLGLNFFRGRAKGGEVEVREGFALRAADGPNGPVIGVFEPADVRVEPEPEATDPAWPNRWRARVRGVESLGRSFRLHLEGPVGIVAEVPLGEERMAALSGEDHVWISVAPERIRVYPA